MNVSETKGVGWNLGISRRLQDSEIREYQCLTCLLNQVSPTDNADPIIWRNRDEQFTVKVYYLKILELRLQFLIRKFSV